VTLHETSSVNKSVTIISDSPPQKPKRLFGNPKLNEFITINSDDSDSASSFPSISEIFKRDPIVKKESISRIATSYTTITTATSSSLLLLIIRDSMRKNLISKSKYIIKNERHILLR
jgi:hypothetical protein